MSTLELIFASVRNFFGMDENATETEVHQKLEAAGTLQDAVASEVKKQVDASMQDLNTRISALEQTNADLKTQVDDREKQIEALNTQIQDAQTAATKAADELKAANDQVKALSGTVASLKAGVKQEQEDVDEGHAALQIKRASTAGAPIPVKSQELQKFAPN